MSKAKITKTDMQKLMKLKNDIKNSMLLLQVLKEQLKKLRKKHV